MKKPWKIIACIPALDDAPECREYFIVRAIDRHAAIAALRTTRSDLLDVPCKVKGEAGQGFLDWLEPDKDVFSIMVVSCAPQMSARPEPIGEVDHRHSNRKASRRAAE